MAIVDAHAHIIDLTFPFTGERGYQPTSSELGDWNALRQTLDCNAVTNAVLVQPSAYGFDNGALVDALDRAEGRCRGIAVVPLDVTERELTSLAAKDVVGVRLNVDFDDTSLLDLGRHDFLSKLKSVGFLVELHASGTALVRTAEAVVSSGSVCVIDHFGRPAIQANQGRGGAAFQALLDLASSSELLYMKLSAPFRVATRPDQYSDLKAVVCSVVRAFTRQRCVWGSDWPFLGMAPRPDYGRLLRLLTQWLPDAEDRESVTWVTPRHLFRFDE